MENDIDMIENLFKAGLFLLFAVILAWISSLLGGYFGRTKNREGEGRWLGFVFGPFGWVLVLLMPQNEIKTKEIVVQPESVRTPKNILPKQTITGF